MRKIESTLVHKRGDRKLQHNNEFQEKTNAILLSNSKKRNKIRTYVKNYRFGISSRVRFGFSCSQVCARDLEVFDLHREVADLGEEFFFLRLVKGPCISWLGTGRFVALGNKVAYPLANLSVGKIVSSGELGSSSASLDDLHDRGGLAGGQASL